MEMEEEPPGLRCLMHLWFAIRYPLHELGRKKTLPLTRIHSLREQSQHLRLGRLPRTPSIGMAWILLVRRLIVKPHSHPSVPETAIGTSKHVFGSGAQRVGANTRV